MTQVLFVIVASFLAISGVDYILGNRLGLGEEFEKGIKAIGPLALNMVGIFMLVPLLSGPILYISEPISNMLGIDVSILPSSMIAVDMGGYQLASAIAYSEEMALFAGIILASNLGATISFSIPVALGMIQEEDTSFFLEGLVIGLIAIPFGSFIGGVAQGIEVTYLLRNMMPLFVIMIVIGLLIVKKPQATIRTFGLLSKGIVTVSIVGLIAAGVTSVIGIEVKYLDIQEAMTIVGRIGLFLAGAYPMLKVISKLFGSGLNRMGHTIGLNEATMTGMVGNLASNLLVFGSFQEMNERGKIVATSFGVSAAFVFGGQLAFVGAIAPSMVWPFILSKISAGIISIVIAIIYLKYIKTSYK